MDALSDVLRAVRLTGAVFFDVKASEPWVAESPAGRSIVHAVFPGAEHLIPYHVVTEGRCWTSLIGEQPIALSTGDIVVFPHQNPARGWTLESLAREVGLSRSALAERFTHFVGQPPMQYLMNWRMQLAAAQLRGSTDSIAAIADRVGYESEAAFSRAFKKSVGVPPSRWRNHRNHVKSH